MATRRRHPLHRPGRRALQALTAAALALPGLAASIARAADDPDFSVQFSRQDDGKRDLEGRSYSGLSIKSIGVDSLALKGGFNLPSGLRLSVGYGQDTWSGASPVVSLPNAAIGQQLVSGASSPNLYYTNPKGVPGVVDYNNCDPVTFVCPFTRDKRLVDLMGSASPETRRQGDIDLSYQWDRATLHAGGGVSVEPDFHSIFANVGGSFNFDHKLTTIDWGLSYTHDSIEANLSANSAADWTLYQDQIGEKHNDPILFGGRHDVTMNLSGTRVLNADALVSAGVSYTRDAGLLMDPYKAVMFGFDDPNQYIFDPTLRIVRLKGVLEVRPTVRNEISADLRYIQYVRKLDAALHLGYRLYVDDWGVTAHTFDASWVQALGHGWSITPDARYYTQRKAWFYQPYFLFNQAYPGNIFFGGQLDWSQIKINDFSSDERLSAFGALSGGVTLEKTLANGATVNLGYEYYTHKGGLKLGGHGDGSFQDFSSSTFHAGVTFDLARRALAKTGDGGGGSADNDTSVPADIPAGVLYAHRLDHAGQFALDLRFAGAASDGVISYGGVALDDQTIINQACGATTCQFTPMRLRHRELVGDFLYAPTDFLTLIVAPRLIETQTAFNQEGFIIFPGAIGPRSGPKLAGVHSRGGFGDTEVVGLFKLFDGAGQHLSLGLGLTAPTGVAGAHLNPGVDYAAYALQVGSGSWAFLPSLTYSGQTGRLSWGAQVSGSKPFTGLNGAGYEVGARFQSTAWTGFRLFDWLSMQGRVNYGQTDALTGPTDNTTPHTIYSPLDVPANYGGRSLDMGGGVTLRAPSGALRGDLLSVEWMQPIRDTLHGYQLPRTGTLNLRLGMSF